MVISFTDDSKKSIVIVKTELSDDKNMDVFIKKRCRFPSHLRYFLKDDTNENIQTNHDN